MWLVTLDVVVTNYQTPGDLDQFLDSYAEFPPEVTGGLWVVLVDPTPADQKVVDKWLPVLGFEVITFSYNCGYAAACNAAGAQGTSDVVAFFNADVILTAGALTECVGQLMNNSQWGILGPRQVDLANRLTAGGIFGTSTVPRHRGWMALDSNQYSDIRTDAVTVSGSALFVKRTVWNELIQCPEYQMAAPDALGAFLPTPHYYEETFMCYHARAHDHKCVFYGPVGIVHKWHQASPHGGWADEQLNKSQVIFREACRLHDIPCD